MTAGQSVDDRIAQSLRDAPGRPLGAGYQATVILHHSPHGELVVKTAHRRLWGRTGIAREYEAYARLEGIAGIPKTYGMLDDTGLVLEYIGGRSLREKNPHNREAFFDRLLATIDAMHAAGVAHCDLKRKDNTLVGSDETPYLVDFGVACILRSGDGRLKRWWFGLMRQMDYNAWVKLRYGRDPRDLPPEVAARYHPLWLERIARWIRIPWQKLTLRRLRKKRSDRR